MPRKVVVLVLLLLFADCRRNEIPRRFFLCLLPRTQTRLVVTRNVCTRPRLVLVLECVSVGVLRVV